MFVLCSCPDPTCVLYIVNICMKNLDSNIEVCEGRIKNNGNIKEHRYLPFVYLGRENSFNYTDKYWIMGPQVNFINPNPKYFDWLLKIFTYIENGATFTVKATDKDGNVTQFTLPYTKNDIKNITPSDSMYRQYKITLDWNNRTKVTE